eukprot:1159519-Amorphochlora_amoeboformis.AAC.1
MTYESQRVDDALFRDLEKIRKFKHTLAYKQAWTYKDARKNHTLSYLTPEFIDKVFPLRHV